MYVFVYGTLKKGYGNNYLLKNEKFLGGAKTYEKYALYNYYYPFAVHEENEEPNKLCLPIIGEVWDVNRNTLKVLDSLEAGYERKVRPVFSDQKGLIQANIYEFSEPNPYGFEVLCDIINNTYEWKG